MMGVVALLLAWRKSLAVIAARGYADCGYSGRCVGVDGERRAGNALRLIAEQKRDRIGDASEAAKRAAPH
ncbi:MAG: hypothetical protein WA661_01155, partial [Xanthobacteraceae bacterium]